MVFGSGVQATGIGQYSGEEWTMYQRTYLDTMVSGDRSVLVRRPDGPNGQRWIVFLADGRELHFATVCDCSGSTYCNAPLTPSGFVAGGKARLVKVVDARGNAITVSYNGPAGVVKAMADDLGHKLTLKQASGASTCTNPRVGALEYDAAGVTTVVASYEYSGDQLTAVRLGGANGAVLRSYEYSSGGYLKSVRNAAGDPIVEFGYDPATGYATSLVDPSSNLTVAYPDLLTAQIQIRTARAYSSKTRTSRSPGGAAHSMGSAGSSSQYAWIARYLRCREDEEHRVHWYDRDISGRITHHAEYAAGDFSCVSEAPTRVSPPVVPINEEWFEFGLEKQIALEGATPVAVPLTTVTKARRTSVLANEAGAGQSNTFERTYDYYDPQNPIAGCADTPLPVGSVLCRYIEDGLTKDIDGNVVRQQRATYFSYDARGRLTKTSGPVIVGGGSDPAAPYEERTYWADSESSVRRGRLHEVKRYPASGATPLVTTYDWDMFGPYQITDPNGRVTLLLRDGHGRVIQRITPDGRATSVRYYDEGRPRLVLRNGGSSWRFAYDDKGRVNRVEMLAGDPDVPGTAVDVAATQDVVYDPSGNTSVVTLAGADGMVRWLRRQEYDAEHRLQKELHPEDPTKFARWDYDASGLLSSITDEEGRTTQILPDGMGRPTTTHRSGKNAAGGDVALDVAAYGYEGGARLKTVTDAAGRTTEYGNDDFGETVSVGSSSTIKSSPWRYGYDARGNVVMRTGGRVATTYAYDALQRLIRVVATNAYDGEQIQYVYVYDTPTGGQGRLGSIVEPQRTTEFTYDEVGRLLTETVREAGIDAPLTTEYRYDVDGDLQTIVYPSGQLTLELDRDLATKNVREVRDARTGTKYASDVTYWPAGPLHGLTFGNGTTLEQTFNLRYEPATIRSGPLSLDYGMTWAGNVASVRSGLTTTTYGHDFLDRLVSFSPGTAAARRLR